MQIIVENSYFTKVMFHIKQSFSDVKTDYNGVSSMKKPLTRESKCLSMMRSIQTYAVYLIGIILLSACTFSGSHHPAIQKFTYFSYLNGDDIRLKCVLGGAEFLRFVYNGIYTEQVRAYDIFPHSTEVGRFILETRVSNTADLSTFVTDLYHPDLFAPWRPVKSSINLRKEDVEKLKLTVSANDFNKTPGYAGDLSSIKFYWLVNGCIEGRFYLKAFVWPESSFLEAQFPDLLSSWDFTAIPINPPRKTSLFEIYRTYEEEEFYNLFTIRIGENRLQ